MRFTTVDGPAIRALRKQAGLTLTGTAALLAEKLGQPVHKATLSRIENNKLEPGPELFDALVEVLNGDRDQLITLELPPQLAEHVRKLVSAAVPASRESGAA